MPAVERSSSNRFRRCSLAYLSRPNLGNRLSKKEIDSTGTFARLIHGRGFESPNQIQRETSLEERSGNDSHFFAFGFTRRCDRRSLKTAPAFERHRGDGHERKLAGNESHEPRKFFVHEAVGMQSNAEHVHAPPGEAGDDVAEDGHDHETARANKSAPARVKNDRAPKDDENGAVFLRVPSPETAPRLVRPNAAEDGADETEERGETNDAISHARE